MNATSGFGRNIRLGRCWQCKNCGSRNDERESTCLHCGKPAALWGEKPDPFTEDEQ